MSMKSLMHRVEGSLVGRTNSQHHSSLHVLSMTLFLFLFSDSSPGSLPVSDMIIENKELDRLVKQYFHIGDTNNENIGFLFCIHGIMLSLPHLKRPLLRIGLKKNNTEAPISVIIKTVANRKSSGTGINQSRIQCNV